MLTIHKEILQARTIQKIVNVNTDGTVSTEDGGGHVTRAIGSGTVGAHVYVQGGLVVGSAPSLPHSIIEV